MWTTVFLGLIQLTVSHLKTKRGRIPISELAEAMEKALKDMKNILRQQGIKVDLEPQSSKR